MNRKPNFKDFYTFAIVPRVIKKKENIPKEFDRLLIAIEGTIPQEKDKLYKWRVLSFPIRKDGTYEILKEPYYKSEKFLTIEEVIIKAKEIENVFLDDIEN